MPSTITSILASPYLTTYKTSVFVATNNRASISNHPFSTGGRLFVNIENQTPTIGSSNLGLLKFAIKIDGNTLAIANTLSDANNGLSSYTIPISGSTGIGISNVPTYNNPNIFAQPIFPVSSLNPFVDFLASSKSEQAFSVTENIQIDFTSPAIKPLASFGTFTLDYIFGLVSDTGNYACYILDAGRIWRGDNTIAGMTHSTKTSCTNTWRILIQSQRVYIQNKQTDNSYLTLFTSNILDLNISGLRLFSCFSINGLSLTNCNITYL